MDRLITIPSDTGFWETLHTAPPPGERVSPFYVVDSTTFELRNVTECDLVEYSLGGEIEVMEEYWEVA